MNYPAQIKTLSRALKGAPLSVFMVMLWLRNFHPPVWEVKELKSATGYDEEALAKARQVLIDLGLAAGTGPSGRYGLQLVDRAVQQLGLWDVAPVGEMLEAPVVARSEKPISPPVVGSSSYMNGPDVSEAHRTTTHPGRSEKPISPSPPHPDCDRLIDRLIAAGCDRRRAAHVIMAALDDLYPAWIELQIVKWSAYCDSKHGETITHRGRFIASKIEDRDECPLWFKSYTWEDLHQIQTLQRALDAQYAADHPDEQTEA